MYVATSKHLFWWPVTVKMPHPETSGRFVEAGFEMRFEALALDRAKELDEERAKLPPEERAARTFDFVFDLARDWRGVVDESRQPITFSREALEKLLRFPWFRDGVLTAYEQALSGREPPRQGETDQSVQ